MCLKSYGDRAFSVAAPKHWNELPLDIKLSRSVDVFKSRLKTNRFRLVFNWFSVLVLLLVRYLLDCKAIQSFCICRYRNKVIIIIVAWEYTVCNKLALKFPTLPPLEKGFNLLFANKLGSLLVVRLSLRSDFPQALALLVSCHLISLPLSCPIQPVLCWGDKKGSANILVLFPR